MRSLRSSLTVALLLTFPALCLPLPAQEQPPIAIQKPIKNWVYDKHNNKDELEARIGGKEASSIGKERYAIVEPNAILYRLNSEDPSAPSKIVVRALRGMYDNATSILQLYDNVQVTTEDGYRLTAREMEMDCRTKKSSSNEDFTLTKPGTTVSGKGFSSDGLLRVSEVKSNPRMIVNTAAQAKSNLNGKPPPAGLLNISSRGKMEITEIDRKEGVELVVFKRDAKMVFVPESGGEGNTTTIVADTLAFLMKKEGDAIAPSRMEATGNVSMNRTLTDGSDMTAKGDLLLWDNGAGKGVLRGTPKALLENGVNTARAPLMLFQTDPDIVILKGPKDLRFAKHETDGADSLYVLTSQGDILIDSQSSRIRAHDGALLSGAETRISANTLTLTFSKNDKGMKEIDARGDVAMIGRKDGVNIAGDVLRWRAESNDLDVDGIPYAFISSAGGTMRCGRFLYNQTTGNLRGIRGNARSLVVLPQEEKEGQK